jgi:hypothetical protein
MNGAPPDRLAGIGFRNRYTRGQREPSFASKTHGVLSYPFLDRMRCSEVQRIRDRVTRLGYRYGCGLAISSEGAAYRSE